MKRLDDLLVQIHEGFDSVLFTSNISERNSTEYYERLLSDDQETNEPPSKKVRF